MYRAQTEGGQLKLERTFFDERWSKHRTVTSLDWSPQVTKIWINSLLYLPNICNFTNTLQTHSFDVGQIKLVDVTSECVSSSDIFTPPQGGVNAPSVKRRHPPP